MPKQKNETEKGKARAFFLQIRTLFSNFQKREGETSPPLPSSYAPAKAFAAKLKPTLRSIMS